MNTKNYPTKKVIIANTLLTRPLSGFFVLPLVAFFITSLNDLDYIGIYLWLCFLFGLLPSFVVGVLINYLKIIITKPFDYIKIFGIGFGVFFVFVVVYFLSQVIFSKMTPDIISYFYMILIAFLIALVGSLSSLILAIFLLPKE